MPLAWPLQCRCHPGFHLKQDGKTCVDVDECTTTYPCAQHCINTHGSFHCLCVDGFVPRPNDPTSCKSTSGEHSPLVLLCSRLLFLRVKHIQYRMSYKNGWVNSVSKSTLLYKCVAYISDEEPFLIFANRYYLRKLNLDGSNYTLIKQVRWLSA